MESTIIDLVDTKIVTVYLISQGRLNILFVFVLGEVMGLQKVSLPGSRRDTILLSFADAKLSVVEYDPANHDLKSVSLHIFEDDESKGKDLYQV